MRTYTIKVADAYSGMPASTRRLVKSWYWHLIAPNGRIMLDGAEGYASRSNAMRAARRAVKVLREAPIDVV